MIAIDYPVGIGGEPGRISAGGLALIASSLRRQLGSGRFQAPTTEALAARAVCVLVNGRELRLAWDIEGDVRDEEGAQVLGACVHDPAEPETVMIYVNGRLLEDRPEVLRSTAVHELAHAVFDMPAALGGRARRAFRSTTEQVRAAPDAPIDWAEWRADEFMGAFLVPPDRLARLLTKEAPTFDLRFGWRHDRFGKPVPFIDAEPRDERVGWLVDHLAETFGVTAPFMATRLRRGGLIGRPRGLENGR